MYHLWSYQWPELSLFLCQQLLWFYLQSLSIWPRITQKFPSPEHPFQSYIAYSQSTCSKTWSLQKYDFSSIHQAPYSFQPFHHLNYQLFTHIFLKETDSIQQFFILNFWVSQIISHRDQSFFIGLILDTLNRKKVTSSSIFSFIWQFWFSLSCSKR